MSSAVCETVAVEAETVEAAAEEDAEGPAVGEVGPDSVPREESPSTELRLVEMLMLLLLLCNSLQGDAFLGSVTDIP